MVLHNRNGLEDEDLLLEDGETLPGASGTSSVSASTTTTVHAVYADDDIEETGKVIRDSICEHVFQEKKSRERGNVR
jgi:hypothetical protein